MILNKSKEIYQRSQKVLAGPSTFGKDIDKFAYGITPYSISKAKGAYAWDVDGNKYIDTIMALGAVTLGHCHPDVDDSVAHQLKKGSSLSLTHELEVDVAEMLCERIPCAEMVRFGKNGSDVTSAAVRLSRYISGEDHILFCGYHGWQDWYISQTSMSGGIPEDVKKYSHRFNYNDINSLVELITQLNGKIACIILEPTSLIEPNCEKICDNCRSNGSCKGFLNQVREIASKNNIILIFDEIVTGFRFDRGGYQKLAGVTPDLACFSKAMGNGMPISALVGKKEYMRKSQKIFYSLTFGGEALSLAAAKSTLKVIDKENAPLIISQNGQYLLDHLNRLINNYSLEKIISFKGYPCRNAMVVNDYESTPSVDIRTYFIQECTKLKVLTGGYHIVSLAHNKLVIDKLMSRYDKVLNNIQKALSNNTLLNKLECPTSNEGARSL